MGIETSPDVEESTEPPICPCTGHLQDQHTNVASNGVEVQSSVVNEKSNKPSNGKPPSIEPAKENPAESAHLVDPAHLTVLLQTDLRYVSA
jgi:Na+-exporting ATPase